MGLDSVLIDEARLTRKAATTLKVGGRTTVVDEQPGPWFACRLFLPGAPEALDSQRVYRRVVRQPTLLFSLDYDDGTPVEVRPSDLIEVRSDDLGDATWQIVAAPEPLRRKEGLIGWQVTLKRVEVPEMTPKAVV